MARPQPRHVRRHETDGRRARRFLPRLRAGCLTPDATGAHHVDTFAAAFRQAARYPIR
ncbi:hypothetical protein F01_420061 [Burkholderia cenocepacia]|nr:hypothetical protein F01_420061 [Burkholderia cenocepacia]